MVSLNADALLDRKPHPIMDSLAVPVIKGQRLFITGAGGSIGSEIAKVAAKYGPKSLVLMDRSEAALFQVSRHLTLQGHPHIPVLGDVAVADDVNEAIGSHRPDVVFHAAAHKHVPMTQSHPAQAVKNNVLGTLNMAVACEGKVERFVLVSTDKAVRPAGVMGQTKRLAEAIIQQYPKWGAVRFGNVIGSSGSVVETWEAQIAAGVPMTVTGGDMTRYFITVNEAAGLVIQCAGMGGGGYILDMGKPIRIIDLAHRVSEAYDGWSIRISGVRPGEKMHEELWQGDEMTTSTDHPGIMRYTQVFDGFTRAMIEELTGTGAHARDGAAMRFLDVWAPKDDHAQIADIETAHRPPVSLRQHA